MKRCRLTITTAVDGRETELSCEGELSLSVCSATLCYQQDGASVSLILDGETAKIERIGDYSKRGIVLKPGQTMKGLFDERTPMYKNYSDFTLDCDGKSFGKYQHNAIKLIENQK